MPDDHALIGRMTTFGAEPPADQDDHDPQPEVETTDEGWGATP